ncbi:MAG: hypothetical protein HY699_08100 [Deltaproteobacteria bacterium]|nr:hypothetical protein [Deltaproteobacteria bacterium]
MDLLLIQRDALASSLVGSLVLAINAKAAGQEVGVLFTQAALAALARGSFDWPRELSGQELRLLLADHAARVGAPVCGGRGDGRQLDAKALVARARDAGVVLYACPIWSALLGLDGGLPQGLQPLDAAGLLELIHAAKTVIGSL